MFSFASKSSHLFAPVACSSPALSLFWREEDAVYPNPSDDPRYVTVDEIIKNITKEGE